MLQMIVGKKWTIFAIPLPQSHAHGIVHSLPRNIYSPAFVNQYTINDGVSLRYSGYDGSKIFYFVE